MMKHWMMDGTSYTLVTDLWKTNLKMFTKKNNLMDVRTYHYNKLEFIYTYTV